MNIENFLMENLIDTYANYCKYAENVSDKEFDEQFELEDGSSMSDLDYFLENSDDILNEEVIEDLYCYLIDNGAEKDFTLQQILCMLVSKYFVYNYYDGNNNIVRFLKTSNLSDIENLFVENINFGTDVLRTYFLALTDSQRCEHNRKRIYDNNDQDVLLEFESKNNSTNIVSLNNLLRKVVYNLYHYYSANGCDDITALNNTWEYFFSDSDPLRELEQFGFDFVTKQRYKIYLMNLIYADLYEDVCNKSIIDSENLEDRLADVLPIILVNLGMIAIPKEEGTRNRILKHFILLQDEKEKTKENRKKTYKDNRIKELKKVNPFYLLDELTF